MKTTTTLQERILTRIANGEKIGCYPTGDDKGYSDYYRIGIPSAPDSEQKTIPSKTFWAMRERELITLENFISVSDGKMVMEKRVITANSGGKHENI